MRSQLRCGLGSCKHLSGDGPSSGVLGRAGGPGVPDVEGQWKEEMQGDGGRQPQPGSQEQGGHHPDPVRLFGGLIIGQKVNRSLANIHLQLPVAPSTLKCPSCASTLYGHVTDG